MRYSPSEIFDLVSANAFRVSSEFSEPLVQVMLTARDLCGGDLETALIMLVITLRTSTHPDFRALTPDDIGGERPAVLPSYGTNVRSIAASTGIANETVRRKVLELIEWGWVARDGGDLKYTAAGYAEVSEVRDRIIQMYVKGHGVIERLLAQETSASTALDGPDSAS